MTIESEQDLQALQRIGRIVAQVRHDMLDAIEPGMTTAERDDGWTLFGPAGTRSAQYEHTMVITHGSPIVVTRH